MWEGELFFERYVRSGGRRFLHRLLESQQYNGPGDAVARRVRATGPVETVSSACASGAMAIGLALQALRRGDVDVAVAGGSDSLCQITYGGFNALRSIDPEPSRPFRKDRAGLSLGEGAAALLLETAEHARARGARVLAEVRGAAATCDAHHMTAPEPGGTGAAAALRGALEDAALDPALLDFVNAHGTGTPLNDAAEAQALRAVLGPRAAHVPVTSTKSLVGHLLGSAGALEAAVTVRCLVEGEVHPMPAGGQPDLALELDLVVGEPRKLARCEHAASINLAFGGANAALVFSRHA
jgi:3-oxoacyl-[acyl-carrier-protein] synthase II